MKHGIVFILSALLICAIFTGCGVFGADPTITSFTATSTSIETGDSITVTIKGSTRDASVESDLIDYTGTIEITSSPAGISKEITIADTYATGFTATQLLTFDTAGTYTLSATLTAGGTSTIKTLTITVTDAAADTSRPWDGETVYTISSTRSWNNDTIDWAGDVDWYKFSTSQSFYVIHWQDKLDYLSSAYGCDVKVSVYNADGELVDGPQDYGCWDTEYDETYESYGSNDGIRIRTADGDYTSGEYIYIKIQGYYTSSTGSYSIYLY